MDEHRRRRKRIHFIAGMPRAATTFLYHTLALHPSIFVPARKETDYFSVNYYRGEGWYLKFFENMKLHQAGFDISPIYFMDEKSLGRIVKFNGDAKVILIIRTPIDWIFSLYKHAQAKSYKKIDFKRFLEGYIYKKDSKRLLLQFKNSKIASTIEKYRKVLGSNLLLCKYEVLNESPLPVLKAIERFVNKESFFRIGRFENVRINSSDQEPPAIVNILMQKKLFSDSVTRIFPKTLIMSVRYKLQAASKNSSRGRGKIAFTEKQVLLANEYFAEDVEYVSNLFEEFRILTAQGTAFD